MDTSNDFEVRLWEDEIEKDEIGKIVHHPLNSRYFVKLGEDTVSYGHLSFCGHDMDKSSILDDVKVFYLQFFGRPEDYDREDWADPLRQEVLYHITGNNRCWYLSMISRWKEGIGDLLAEIVGTPLNTAKVKSKNPYGRGGEFHIREFFEVPNRSLTNIVRFFWSEAYPGYPIEGYNLGSGQIETLKRWNEKLRDDLLFREVIDQTFVNFYTFPAENRYFVFVTNKLDLNGLAKLIKLEELKEQARKIGREIK